MDEEMDDEMDDEFDYETLIPCHTHGEQKAAFVCAHLCVGSGLGFVETGSDHPDDLQALCHNCANHPDPETAPHWRDDDNIKLVCAACFETIRKRNRLQLLN